MNERVQKIALEILKEVAVVNEYERVLDNPKFSDTQKGSIRAMYTRRKPIVDKAVGQFVAAIIQIENIDLYPKET